ncbi:MAG: methyltransferase family protein [bacterium]
MERPLPPTYFLIAVLLMAGLHAAAPAARIVPGLWKLLGLLPISAGIGLALWSHHFFHHTGTAVRPFEEPTHLLLEGPYRFSRHPMYLGMFLVLAGLAVVLGSLSPFAVLVPYWLVTERFAAIEERAMERAFGEEYRAYRERVRRWL